MAGFPTTHQYRMRRYNFAAIGEKDSVLARYAAECANQQQHIATPDLNPDGTINGALAPGKVLYSADKSGDAPFGERVTVVVGKPTVAHLSEVQRIFFNDRLPPAESDVWNAAGEGFANTSTSTVEKVRDLLEVVASREENVNLARLMRDFEKRFPKPAPPLPRPTKKVKKRERFEVVGSPIFSAEDLIAAGRHFGAGRIFFELVPAFYEEYEKRVQAFGVAASPDFLLGIQGTHECGWFRVNPNFGRYCSNPECTHVGATGPFATAGIKTGRATADTPRDFERPRDARAAAHLHYNHFAAYLGHRVIEPVNSRFRYALQAAGVFQQKNGRFVRYFDDFGGTGVWATDRVYAQKLKERQAEIAHFLVNRQGLE